MVQDSSDLISEQKRVKAYLENHPQLPPGVKVYTEGHVNMREPDGAFFLYIDARELIEKLKPFGGLKTIDDLIGEIEFKRRLPLVYLRLDKDGILIEVQTCHVFGNLMKSYTPEKAQNVRII